MRLRYINSFFGERISELLFHMDESFGFRDSRDYVERHSNGNKGRMSEFGVGILFFN